MRIHEGLTQSVTSAVLELQTLSSRIATDPEAAIASLVAVEAAIRKDLAGIRSILFELDDDSSELPFSDFVNDVVGRWELAAHLSFHGDLDRLASPVREAARSIVGEALANVAKHAGSPEVLVHVRSGSGELRIEVEDRGPGIGEGPAAEQNDSHFGLRLMRNTAEKVNGTLEIQSTLGSGTRIVACLPVDEVRSR
jgi:signal transduction histidine kinase